MSIKTKAKGNQKDIAGTILLEGVEWDAEDEME